MHPATIYILFCFCGRFALGVSGTAYTPFLLGRPEEGGLGLTEADIGLLEAAYSASLFLSEIPTGMLADGRRTRAWALRVGCIIWAMSVFGYTAAIGFWTALLFEVGIGIGNAFTSGAQQAWVTDALIRRGEGSPDQIRRVFSRQGTWSHVAYLSGGILGALICGVHMRLQWMLAGAAIVGTYVLARRYMGSLGEPFQRKSEWQALRASVSTLREQSALRWVVASVMLFSLLIPLQLLWSVFFERRGGMDLVSMLWVLTCGALIAGSWLVRTRHAGAGKEVWVIAGALACGAAALILIPRLPTMGAYAAVALWRFGNGLHQPSVDAYVQTRIDSSYRATFGSLTSFCGRLTSTVVLCGMWFLAVGKKSDNATIGLVWVWCGGALAVGVLLLILLRPRERTA